MTQKKLQIAIVSYFDIIDNYLGETFMFMSQNLEEARWFLLKMNNITVRGAHYPLRYNFSQYPLSFKVPGNISPQQIRDELLVHCQGVIISLAKQALDVEFFKSNDSYSSSLRKLIKVVYKTKLPTVVTIECIDLPDENDLMKIEAIQKILKIPETIPILPYTYDKPSSIENILTTLLELYFLTLEDI